MTPATSPGSAKLKVHLTSGETPWFVPGDHDLVNKVCEESNGDLFRRDIVTIDSPNEVRVYPVQNLVGLTFLIDPLPKSFKERERLSTTVVTQISRKLFQKLQKSQPPRPASRRGMILSHVRLAGGHHLYLKFNELAISGVSERSLLHSLFEQPSMACRRSDRGFSVWNSSQFIACCHSPSLYGPIDARLSALVADHAHG